MNKHENTTIMVIFDGQCNSDGCGEFQDGYSIHDTDMQYPLDRLLTDGGPTCQHCGDDLEWKGESVIVEVVPYGIKRRSAVGKYGDDYLNRTVSQYCQRCAETFFYPDYVGVDQPEKLNCPHCNNVVKNLHY